MRVLLNQFAKSSALGIFLLALSGVVQASPGLWKGFYTPKEGFSKTTVGRPGSGGQNCISEILKAEAKYGIPNSLLLAIGIQEAGWRGPQGLTVWPWTVNADGLGKYFKTRDKALAWAAARVKAGTKSIDVGCMQINLKWHGSAFDGLEDVFSPASNVDYAARFLLSLYKSSGDWTNAAGMYHSRNEGRQTAYLSKLKSNQQYVLTHLDELTSLRPAEKAATASAGPNPPPIFWSASLSQGGEVINKSYSIYSSREIQAILPDFSNGE
jgi:hypothetical protein